mmetsp:Transcript_37521/g.58605  ORF Transcript_37521/g.58605 Transcript_37521/m.58605 type:complete len:544 (+) Transcript_37521:112-1743(+)
MIALITASTTRNLMLSKNEEYMILKMDENKIRATLLDAATRLIQFSWKQHMNRRRLTGVGTTRSSSFMTPLFKQGDTLLDEEAYLSARITLVTAFYAAADELRQFRRKHHRSEMETNALHTTQVRNSVYSQESSPNGTSVSAHFALPPRSGAEYFRASPRLRHSDGTGSLLQSPMHQSSPPLRPGDWDNIELQKLPVMNRDFKPGPNPAGLSLKEARPVSNGAASPQDIERHLSWFNETLMEVRSMVLEMRQELNMMQGSSRSQRGRDRDSESHPNKPESSLGARNPIVAEIELSVRQESEHQLTAIAELREEVVALKSLIKTSSGGVALEELKQVPMFNTSILPGNSNRLAEQYLQVAESSPALQLRPRPNQAENVLVEDNRKSPVAQAGRRHFSPDFHNSVEREAKTDLLTPRSKMLTMLAKARGMLASPRSGYSSTMPSPHVGTDQMEMKYGNGLSQRLNWSTKKDRRANQSVPPESLPRQSSPSPAPPPVKARNRSVPPGRSPVQVSATLSNQGSVAAELESMYARRQYEMAKGISSTR